MVARQSDLLSVADVAARLGVHPATVRRWIADGALDALRIGATGPLRISAAAVDRLLRPVTHDEEGAA